MGFKHDRILILAADQADRDGGEPAVRRLARTLQARLGEALGRGLSIGVGRRALAQELRASAEDARHCLQTIWAFRRQAMILDYEDLGIAGLLLRTADKEELVRFCRRTLGPLLAKAVYRQELLDTLWHYCLSGSNKQAVAERTHIHLNTVKYRLRKIAALTGADLDSAADIQRLQMALHIYRLLDAGEPATPGP